MGKRKGKPRLNGLGFPLCENRHPFEFCYVTGIYGKLKIIVI
jgi:hypothetical protein